AGVPHPPVGTASDEVMAALALDSHDRGEEPVDVHCPDEERQPGSECNNPPKPNQQWDVVRPVHPPTIETRDRPMRDAEQKDQLEPQPDRLTAGPHALLRQIRIDQEQAGNANAREHREVEPKHWNIESARRPEQYGSHQQQKAASLGGCRQPGLVHPRNWPPVAFSTCLIKRFEKPSISASVRVRSCGCSTTVIAS